MRDPFVEYRNVPVPGGALRVARAGAPPDAAAAVVLAVHGMTGSHLAWRAVARELCGDGAACLVAPDLRGRGRSATVRGSYGMSAHVADLLAVLDDAGAARVVLAGHSMGAHVVARLAADHPARAASIVLLDGGIAVPPREDPWDEDVEEACGPALDRMDAPSASAEDYVARWRRHPAFAGAWNDDVEAYIRYEIAEDGGGARCVISEEALMADSFDVALDGSTSTALARVRAPLRLLHASRGLDDDEPLITRAALERLVLARPDVRIERVDDVNHYTLLLGEGPGPARVAAALKRAAFALRRPTSPRRSGSARPRAARTPRSAPRTR